MTIYLRVDNKKDYDWLVGLVDRWLMYDPNNPRLQANIDEITAWKKYLAQATTKFVNLAPEPVVVDVPAPTSTTRRGRPPKPETLAARKKKEKAAQLKADAANPLICIQHPKYGGIHRPTRECPDCWEVYKKMHPADWKPVWAAFERNLKKQQVAQ